MIRALLVVLLLMAGAPAMAGTGVGQSTWNRGQPSSERSRTNRRVLYYQTPLQCDQCAAQHLLDLLCVGLSLLTARNSTVESRD